MKKTIALLSLPFFMLFANEGEKLFDMKCSICHMKTRPTKEMKSSLIALPISGVVKNVKRAFGGDEKATVDFIVSYALNPSLEKVKCKAKALKRFGLMPSQKENTTPAELQSIVQYLYSNFPLAKKNKYQKHQN